MCTSYEAPGQMEFEAFSLSPNPLLNTAARLTRITLPRFSATSTVSYRPTLQPLE